MESWGQAEETWEYVTKSKRLIQKQQCQIGAGIQLTPSYTRAFHECSNFLMNLRRTKTRRSFVTCIQKTCPLFLIKSDILSLYPLAQHKKRLFFSIQAENTSKLHPNVVFKWWRLLEIRWDIHLFFLTRSQLTHSVCIWCFDQAGWQRYVCNMFVMLLNFYKLQRPPLSPDTFAPKTKNQFVSREDGLTNVSF